MIEKGMIPEMPFEKQCLGSYNPNMDSTNDMGRLAEVLSAPRKPEERQQDLDAREARKNHCRRRSLLFRLLHACLSLGVLLLAGYLFFQAGIAWQQADDLKTRLEQVYMPVLDQPVDFSSPCTVEFLFDHERDSSNGKYSDRQVSLRTSEPWPGVELSEIPALGPQDKLMKSTGADQLRYQWSLWDSSGSRVPLRDDRETQPTGFIGSVGDLQSLVLFSLPEDLKPGLYRLRIDVTAPAPGLKGMEQRLIRRDMLGKGERMRAGFLRLQSRMLCVLGMVVLLVGTFFLRWQFRSLKLLGS
jgi:hypothetical protein